MLRVQKDKRTAKINQQRYQANIKAEKNKGNKIKND